MLRSLRLEACARGVLRGALLFGDCFSADGKGNAGAGSGGTGGGRAGNGNAGGSGAVGAGGATDGVELGASWLQAVIAHDTETAFGNSPLVNLEPGPDGTSYASVIGSGDFEVDGQAFPEPAPVSSTSAMRF